jgi:gelsolin
MLTNASFALRFQCTMGTVTTLDQDQGDEEYPEFWDLIGRDGDIAPYQEEEDEQGMMEFEPRLYRVDGDPQRDLQLVATASRMVHKKSPSNTKREADPCFKRTDLKDDDVFLIDSGWDIFVWIGSNADRSEKIAGMNAADRYSKLDPRTVELPVHIVKSGHESDAFSALFD